MVCEAAAHAGMSAWAYAVHTRQVHLVASLARTITDHDLHVAALDRRIYASGRVFVVLTATG